MSDFKLHVGSDVQSHPWLSHIGATGADDFAVAKGYIGPSSKEGYVRIYPTLDNTSEWMEFAKTDILGFAEAPATLLPLGGTVVWLKKGVNVAIHRVATVSAGSKPVEPPNTAVINAGRLRMLLPGRLRATEVCQSRCSVCQSRCSVCHSRCAAAFGSGAFAEERQG
jgi:hypothetical protein